MDYLDFIKGLASIREFKDKLVKDEDIEKIVEAGIWGFSVLGMQAWNFVIIKSKSIKNNIADAIKNNLNNIPREISFVSGITAESIRKAGAIIAVYNTGKITKRMEIYGDKFNKHTYAAELQSIGGAIQNMFIEASSLGLGCVWVDSPSFFEKDINKILGENNQIVAFLLIGYPAEKAKRSKRQLSIKSIKKV